MHDTVDTGYRPREQFVDFHKRTQRFAAIVAHRRAGKTVACVADLQDAALRCERERPRFAYVAPFLKQAKAVAWDYLKAGARELIQLGATVNESELKIDYPNGAQVRLYGADNADALRGLYLDGVVCDEYADWHPRVWGEIIRPALADRTGWAVFIGTPKGRNAFHETWEKALADPSWYSLILKASETEIIPQSELDLASRDLSPNQYAQEFECSFDAAIIGSYYGDLLNASQAEGRIGNVATDPIIRKRAFWDIGGAGAKADANAIWVVQWVSREIRVLDYIEGVGQVLAYYVEQLRARGHGGALCILPHDGINASSITGKRYVDHLEEAGLEAEVIANQGAGADMMRVEAARRIFSRCWFNDTTTKAGREALAYYHERIDEKRSVGLGPDHDWSSHAADAWGLMAVSYEEPRIRIRPEETDVTFFGGPKRGWMSA